MQKCAAKIHDLTAQCDDYTPIDVAAIVHEWTCEMQNQKAKCSNSKQG